MEKHLLVTISDDLSALHGVRFVGSFFENKGKIHLTLLYVSHGLDAAHREGSLEDRRLNARLADAQAGKGRVALDASRKILVDKGFPYENIKTKLVGKRIGTAKDIVHEGRAGLYDAVVLGRRGYTLFETAFATSVTRELMDLRIDFPVWICRLPEERRKNVLLCVMDTEACMRMADHVGFILGSEGTTHSVTLLHVDTGEVKGIETMMERTAQCLKDNGVGEERITRRVVRTPRVVRAILEEMEKGSYAAVGVGRGGGQSQGLFQKWLGGSVSMNLLETLEKAALWVSK